MTQDFILQEASETLDTTRPWMDETWAIRQRILANQPEAWPAIEQSSGNGSHRTA